MDFFLQLCCFSMYVLEYENINVAFYYKFLKRKMN